MRQVISKVFSVIYRKLKNGQNITNNKYIIQKRKQSCERVEEMVEMVISLFCKCAHCSHYVYLDPYSLITPVPIKLLADKSLMSHLAHCQNDWPLSLRKWPEPVDDGDGHRERSLTHLSFTRLEWVGLINLGLLYFWIMMLGFSTRRTVTWGSLGSIQCSVHIENIYSLYIRCKICSHTKRDS